MNKKNNKGRYLYISLALALALTVLASLVLACEPAGTPSNPTSTPSNTGAPNTGTAHNKPYIAIDSSIVNLWPLLGVAIIIVGFILRFNPFVVVVVTAFVTAALAGFPFQKVLAELGTGFVKTRNLLLILVLPLGVIGLLERHGLRQHAQNWISHIKSATAGRLLIVYLGVRQLTAAIGLTSLGGQPQMVRPLLAPMAEGATETRYGKLTETLRYRLRAFSAATDNVGLFFGENIFVAFGAIVLMTTFLHEAGIDVKPIYVAMWGIPTAICAFLIHAYRLRRLDQFIAKEMAQAAAAPAVASATRETGAT